MRLLKILVPVLLFSFLCISLCFTFFSCTNNNPVTPAAADTTIDSARYNWTDYELPTIINPGVWIRDTNDIFFNNGGYIHFHNGVSTEFPIEDYFVDFIAGGDKNTGYLIGHSYYLQDSLIRIKKWNGSSFTEIFVNNNKSSQLWTCFFNKPDEIWLTTFDGKISKFNGTALINTPINLPAGDTCFIDRIYFDSTVQKVRALIQTSQAYTFDKFSLLEFNGISWDRTADLEVPDYFRPYFTKGYVISFDESGISYLNNTALTHFINYNGLGISEFLGGDSRHNMFVRAYQNYNEYSLFNWNGAKWSREHSAVGNLAAAINEKTILIYGRGSDKIAIGTKK